MNEKDLVLEKEYLLGEAKRYKGVYKGNFGKAHYFGVSTGHDFTQDANGYVEFPLRGVFEIEKWSFITPIAMKCTEEQFNGIKDRLVEIGYKVNWSFPPSGTESYIVNDYRGNIGYINNSLRYSNHMQKRLIFETFNPDLFLAIAAMTDKEDGIKGEWWRCIDDTDTAINCLYIKVANDFSEMFRGDSNQLVKTGFCFERKDEFRKATAQEIIEHFEKKEKKYQIEKILGIKVVAYSNLLYNKEFVLPERWMCCVNSKKEFLSVVDYARTKNAFMEDYNDIAPSKYPYYIGMEKNGAWAYNNRYINSVDGKEITFDQFKKYVLKESRPPCQNKKATHTGSGLLMGGFLSEPAIRWDWHINDKKEIVLEDRTIIPIPSGKQAELFDDRVEIKDWKPKEGEYCDEVYLHENGKFHYRHVKYKDSYSDKFKAGFIKKNGKEADELRTRLNNFIL